MGAAALSRSTGPSERGRALSRDPREGTYCYSWPRLAVSTLWGVDANALLTASAVVAVLGRIRWRRRLGSTTEGVDHIPYGLCSGTPRYVRSADLRAAHPH